MLSKSVKLKVESWVLLLDTCTYALLRGVGCQPALSQQRPPYIPTRISVVARYSGDRATAKPASDGRYPA